MSTMNLRTESKPGRVFKLFRPGHFMRVCLIVITTCFAFSCDDDDKQPKGQYADGVFVVNEGAYTKANGSITFLTRANEPMQDIFAAANNGLALGDVVQSMIIDDNAGYLVVNNSNKLEVVNAGTFESSYRIEGLRLPRYMTTEGGFGYLTEWVSFTDDGRVSVIDLDKHEVVDQITTGSGAENILEDDNLLYVSNNFSNTVSVIDIATREVIKTIEVAWAPGELLEDTNGKIWVLCGGSWGGNDGALVQIDPSRSKQPEAQSVLKTVELGMNVGFPKAAISVDGLSIFYFAGTKVYKFDVNGASPPSDALIDESAATNFYGIGVDPKTNILYVADDKAFSSAGTVFRYELTGTAIDNFASGIGPNGFAFYD